ncbi:protein-glutamate O-methyltransferase CheR [Danxiaibacter flavus]|uniref:Protein-glutamate O-methyltransferase CheR n=1 Tax=Danxiaibacter flavus TaxID=3049108 RepID=A0ABV3ZK55_9BACT|nr:protein-glutamate O-methyltransferase CheR [Chitinophagaceae bacterium DXS]
MEINFGDKEIDNLLNDILDIYGYDFTEYSKASLTRRLHRLYLMDKFKSFGDFSARIQTDPVYFKHAVQEISVNVTEMLRDPYFYKTVREKIIPVLATYPFIRIWHAGCATGEEVYSMAILLKEAGLLQKSLLYGTDINPVVLEKARKGIFPISQMQQYSTNYLTSGGTNDFSSYYTANYNLAKFDESLSRRMVFSTHNLVSDSSFNSFQLIFCRNVLIYFEKDLQAKVLRVFDNSLELFGFLALGSKESLRFSSIAGSYKQVDPKEKIWKKLK